MRKIALAALCLCLAGLGGCSTFTRFGEDGSYGVAAAELTGDPAKHGKDLAWALVNQSERNCNAFMNGVVAVETGTGATLDLANTVFSALGTAVSPVGTAHAFAAAGTITSGWRANITADVFAKASAGNYAEAIQSTYYKSMADYINKLSAATTIEEGAEEAKIRSIHAQCSLAAAQSSIAASLKTNPPATPPGSQQSTDRELVAQAPAAGAATTTITLTAGWGSTKVDLPIAVAAGDTADTIVSKVKTAVSGNDTLKGAGIGTADESPPAPGKVLLRSPASTGVQWSLSPGAGPTMVLMTAAPPAAMMAPPVQPPPSDATTSAVVPGQDVRSY